MTTTFKQEDWQKVLAEVVGTFFFFFIGIGSIASAGDLGVLYVALAHGVALAIAISALGHISGGHFNPAVTIALAVVRKISPALAVLYIVGQIVGGVLACLALTAVLPAQVWQQFALGTPGIGLPISSTAAIGFEAVLTFFLLLAVFGTAVDPRASRVAGFGIGLTVFVDILVGGPFTGAVMNPARALTPAIVSGTWDWSQLIYWVGPIIGGIVAAVVYNTFLLPKGDEEVIVVPQLAEGPTEPPVSEPGLISDRLSPETPRA